MLFEEREDSTKPLYPLKNCALLLLEVRLQSLQALFYTLNSMRLYRIQAVSALNLSEESWKIKTPLAKGKMGISGSVIVMKVKLNDILLDLVKPVRE